MKSEIPLCNPNGCTGSSAAPSPMFVEANTKAVEGFVTIRADTFFTLVNTLDVLI